MIRLILCALLLSVGLAVAQDPAKKADERDRDHDHVRPSACDGSLYPINKGGSPSCCQAGNELFHANADPNDPTKTLSLGHRRRGRACTVDGRTWSHCAGKDCAFGPCGAMIVEVLGAHDTVVFHPNSNPNVCGYQTKTADGQIISSPEPYTNQELYPNVVPACPYTACLGDGRRGVTLSLTAVAGTATGHVKSDPAGVDLSGAGTASVDFERTVNLVAEPAGNNARAVFSGACTKSGDYGRKAWCSLNLAPDQKVTVTYECRANSTCLGAH